MEYRVDFEPLEGRTFLTAAHGFVYTPHAKVLGKTLGQWAGEWVKWLAKTPASDNPLLDTTGVDAKVGQPGKVFFLAGTNGSGSVTRKVTITAGEPIFLPVVNSYWVNVDKAIPGVQETPDPPFKTGEPAIRALFQDVAKGFKKLFASVDGNPVYSLSSHREEDPKGGFTVKWAQDTFLGLPGDHLGTTSATIGIYLMLKPLSVGTHTIHFGGTSAYYNPDATQDNTYKITVVSKQSSSSAVPAASKPAASPFADGKSVASLVLDG